MSATKDFPIACEMNVAPNRLGEKGGTSSSSFSLEPFVSPETVSAFLSVARPDVLRLTREGKIRGYPYKGRLRHVYRYRLSEVSADFEALASKTKGTIPKSALASQRRKSNG